MQKNARDTIHKRASLHISVLGFRNVPTYRIPLSPLLEILMNMIRVLPVQNQANNVPSLDFNYDCATNVYVVVKTIHKKKQCEQSILSDFLGKKKQQFLVIYPTMKTYGIELCRATPP